jgi:hypothetical protein
MEGKIRWALDASGLYIILGVIIELKKLKKIVMNHHRA